MTNMTTELRKAIQAYDLPGVLLKAERYGDGHINDTFCLTCRQEDGQLLHFMLQRLSRRAFPHPEEVMENFVRITGFLQKKILEAGGDPARETLTLIRTRDGQAFYTDPRQNVWRMTAFVEGTFSLSDPTPGLMEAAGHAFGRFGQLLRDFPAETLHETIPSFHHTELHLQKLKTILREDPLGRAALARTEADFILAREADCRIITQARRDGLLPLRVTHNDTRLSNVLFDVQSGRGICIVDLDTTMPGLVIFDFGDAIRSAATLQQDKKKDPEAVHLDPDLYDGFTRGFLAQTADFLTKDEVDLLPWGARIITLELAIRYLSDYLEGDHYFRSVLPQQNLLRCRRQLSLLKDMEAQFTAMQAIVQKYAAPSGA